MRELTVPMLVVLLGLPAAAAGQSFGLYGAAGPTITDAGNSVAAGAGVSLGSRVALVASFERTHLSTRVTRTSDVVSTFRGGTLLLGTGELRVSVFSRDRWGPYGVAGLAAGVSHPNVNELFPNPITNDVLAMIVGGGVRVPLSPRVTVFADLRMLFGAEGTESIVAIAPLRAGVAWFF